MAWNKKTNPTVTGKYLVAVNNGTGKVSFEIGYWSNDLSKIEKLAIGAMIFLRLMLLSLTKVLLVGTRLSVMTLSLTKFLAGWKFQNSKLPKLFRRSLILQKIYLSRYAYK